MNELRSHYDRWTPVDASSSHDLPETWGAADDPFGEKLRLGIDTDDTNDPQLCIDYLPNGRIAAGTVNFGIEESAQFALALLRLTSAARGCTTAELITELLARQRH
jgi:hypothetical protein